MDLKTLLDQTKTFIDEMNQNNSLTHKRKVFEKLVRNKNQKVVVQLIQITYDPFSRFHATSKNVRKYRKTHPVTAKKSWSCQAFYKMLNDLKEGSLSGHAALSQICNCAHHLSDDQEDTLYRVLDKDLKMRFGIKQMNKIEKNFLYEFSVSLGYAHDSKTKNIVEKGNWYISRKLDGVRCVTWLLYSKTHDSWSIQFYSRTGKPFITLQKLENVLLQYITPLLEKKSWVLDGEVCSIDKKWQGGF